MKRVDNSDVNIKLDSRIVYLSNFNAKFYTVNAENFFIRKTQDNVISAETEDNDTEYYIKLDWNELVTLGEGVLQYKIVNNVPDSDRADLYFNKNLERTTEYYINSNVTVDPESEQSYAEIIAELGVKIDTEIARSTSADTVHDEAIQDEVITRQQNVSDLTDLISANNSGITQNRSDIGDLSTALSNEITNRQNADAAISGAVDTVLANYLTISAFTEAEETISASLNDLNDRKLDASAYTPTDLSNYYTKNQVYTKTEVDNAITTETNRATSAETTISNNLNTESRTRKWADTQIENNLAIVSGAVDTKLDTSAYTPTDLSNYYTKSEVYNKTEVDNAIAAIDISDQLSGYVQTSAFTSYSAATKDNIDYNYNHLSNLINTKADSRDVKQSDWEVIAASDNAYIKHKPFGEEPIDLDPYKYHGKEFIGNGKVGTSDSYAIHNYGINSRGLKVGDTVKINVDGDESMTLTITTLNGRLVSDNVTGNSYTDFNPQSKAALYQEGAVNASGYCQTWGLVYIPQGNFDISKNHVISWYLVDSVYGQYITETKQIDNKYINYSGDTYIQSLVTRIEELETQVNEWKNNGISAGDY